MGKHNKSLNIFKFYLNFFLVFVLSIGLFLTLPINHSIGNQSNRIGLEAYAAPYNGWYKENGYWYYNVNGVPVKGWLTYDGSQFYFDNSGRMYIGWYPIGGYWYFFEPQNESGRMQINQWISPYRYGNTCPYWAYVDGNGRAVTGWNYLLDGGNHYYYYFDSAGNMQTGWLKWDGSWFYLRPATNYPSTGPTGSMVMGWQLIEVGGYNYYHYFNPAGGSGRMLTGWQIIGGLTYYLRPANNNPAIGDEGGRLESGVWTISGQKAWFYANGSWNSVINNITLGTSTTTSQRNALSYDYTYYSQGSYDQNCLTFALDGGNVWTWPWGSNNATESQAKSYLTSKGYTIMSVNANVSAPYIVAYKNNSGLITHFARVNSSGCIYAKWGSCEIFRHSSINPYHANGAYGVPAFIAK